MTVYRIAQDGEGRAFGFIRKGSRTQREPQQWLEGPHWVADNDSPEVVAKLSSPKTTDILSIRALDGDGLAFFDKLHPLACRRAAWFSLATVLQRSIALELDVDSLDIEIASVHKYTDSGLLNCLGAELYLSDEHPNGSGLVEWASQRWDDLLEGCLAGVGPCNRLGRMIQEECRRATICAQPWRSPDLLLKGFRNRQLHGLIDWRLGLELMSTLQNTSYLPGLDQNPAGWSIGGSCWAADAKRVADSYCDAFESGANTRQIGPKGLQGWMGDDSVGGQDGRGMLHIVVHPLWEVSLSVADPISDLVIGWAKKLGARRIRMLDSFNLGRRMSWVRANLNLFETLDLDFSFDDRFTGSSPARPVDWMADLENLSSGQRLMNGEDNWLRVTTRDGWATGNDGIWIARVGAIGLREVIIRTVPGRGVVVKPRGDHQSPLSRQTTPSIQLIGHRDAGRPDNA